MPFVLARMLRPLTHRRSNGIAVPLGIARLIRSGDRARREGDWAKAGSAYRATVAKMPRLGHIWIQAGHAGKETGDLDAAVAAYLQAAALSADDPEPHIHLGHVTKLAGRSPDAAEHYFEALRRSPDSLAAAAELMRTVDPDTPRGRDLIERAIALVGLESLDERIEEDGAADASIYFDVTDLLAYFSHARLPTGIQRVQIELVLGAINAADARSVSICCFSEAWHGWRRLSAARFLRVAAASLTSDDREDPFWRREVISALLDVVAKPKIEFGAGTALLNVGSSWSERNYFLHLRNAQDGGGPLYIPLIYDLIPMRNPEWFPPALVRDYRAWIDNLAAHASAFFAISDATADDLRRIGMDRNSGCREVDVTVVTLDGDFRSPVRKAVDPARLARWQLKPNRFVLMVSTIEPRKNHLGIFRAWRRLLDQMPMEDVPMLVCVGGRGWMNDQAHALLADDAMLRSKILLLHGIGDADLALLYQSCFFTTYPSFYEGWGLPVTESLCYGKVPAISDTSSMPQAGGRYAVYFDPHNIENMADTLRRLIEEPNFRLAKEADIASSFCPRPWTTIAETLLADVDRLVADCPVAISIPVSLEDRLTLGSQGSSRTSGETLRHGTGWAPPGPDGSGVLEGGALLRLPTNTNIPSSSIKLRLTVRSGEPRHVAIKIDGVSTIDALLEGNATQWIALPPTSEPIREITICDLGFQSEQIGMGRSEAVLVVAEIAWAAD